MAYWHYKKTHNILFYVDKNCKNYSRGVYDKQVFLPSILKDRLDVPVIIAVESDYDIVEYLTELGVRNIEKFIPNKEDYLEKIVIYGVGDWGHAAYNQYSSKTDVVFFVDRNPEKQGVLLHGKMIYSPGILSLYQDIPVIIAVEKCEGIELYLQELGCKHIKNFIPYRVSYDTDFAGVDSWEKVPYLDVYDAICEYAKEKNDLPFNPQVTRRFLGINQYTFDLSRLIGMNNEEFIQGLYAFFFRRLMEDEAKEYWEKHPDLEMPEYEFQRKYIKGYMNSKEFRSLGDVTVYNNIYG